MDLKGLFQQACQKGWDLCVTSPVEIIAGAALFTLLGSVFSYQHEAGKRGYIPLAYSEIEQTIRANGNNVPPLTTYYSVVNDIAMEVFDANNHAYTDGRGTAYDFARALDLSLRTMQSPLQDYTHNIDGYAREALAVLKPLEDANTAIQPVIDALENAWHDTHIDHYRTEARYSRSCDSKNNCTTTTYYVQVYDHTIHTFTYYPEQGNLAARLLNEFAAAHPDIKIDEQLIHATSISPYNRGAMDQSHKYQTEDGQLSEEDYLRLVNTWATGSNYGALTPQIYSDHTSAVYMAPLWDTAKETARNERYRTMSRSHSGPQEFQIAEGALNAAQNMSINIAATLNGIAGAPERVYTLGEKIDDYIDVVLHDAPGSAGRLRGEIMSEARALYNTNYSAGFDVAPAKWWMVAIWGLLGGLAGAGLGFGADRLIDRHASRNGGSMGGGFGGSTGGANRNLPAHPRDTSYLYGNTR